MSTNDSGRQESSPSDATAALIALNDRQAEGLFHSISLAVSLIAEVVANRYSPNWSMNEDEKDKALVSAIHLLTEQLYELSPMER